MSEGRIRKQRSLASEEERDEQAWQELERLSQQVSARWRSDRSALELLDEIRREEAGGRGKEDRR